MRNYTTAVLFVLVFLITAHFIAPDSYDLREHTISQLAAQNYDRGWVMRIGMFGFGALLLLAALSRLTADQTRRWTEGPLVICGALFILSSAFSTRPFQPNVPYSDFEAVLHGVASTTARILVSISMLSYAIRTVERDRRIVHIRILSLVIGLNVLLEVMGTSVGIVQRVLSVVVLAWLVFIDFRQVDTLGREKEKLAV